VSTAAILPEVERPRPDADDAERYEIIDGVRVVMPPMSAQSNGLAALLAYYLTHHGLAGNVGLAYPEMLFKLPLPVDRNRRPDVAFVPFSRWPKTRPFPTTNTWDVLPDLAVEVVSPSDLAEDDREKVREYFRAGIRLVWVIYPRLQLVDVYESAKIVRVLERDEELDGGAVLPGFRLPLRDLFIGEPTGANGGSDA
jgi:Uma2 family endonuclease